jgi:hypothetical protein
VIKINEIAKPRSEVLEGKFQGVIQSNKVDANEKRLETNPEEFLRITYPSSAIKRTLERIAEKNEKKSNQGAFLLVGPYGSGKSHALISLYHIFNRPEIANKWAKEWDIDFKIPEKSRSVIISTRKYDVDYIWEPIFAQLGRNDLLKEIKRFPTVDQIEEAIGNNPVAIFIDELENWYGSFDPVKQGHIIEQNETFLEHLLEVANDPNKKLFVFITFLGEKEELKKILERTKPVQIDVSTLEDRERVTLHRLFENAGSFDENKIEGIVNDYLSKYDHPIEILDNMQYKLRMKRIYPFHPVLFDSLVQIFESASERQDIRGMLNILADAINANYNKTDLLLLSDLDENDFRGINLNLVEKFSYDLKRSKDVSFANEILKSILIFSLNDKVHGASLSDILLSVFKPTQDHTIDQIVGSLQNQLYGKVHYLHKINDFFVFKEEINIYALIENEKSKVKEDEAKKKIAEIVKQKIFDNKVLVYDFDTIPDDSKPKIVVSLTQWGTNSDLKDRLNDFYKGRLWQNTYIIVFPNREVLTPEITEKTKRVIAAERIKSQTNSKEDEAELRQHIEEEVQEVAERIKAAYGQIIKWVEHNDALTYRFINTTAEITTIKEKTESDAGVCGEYIIKAIEDKPDGIKVDLLIKDFKKNRKHPFILEENVIYNAIRILHRDKKLIIEGERGKFYTDDSPKTIDPDYVIISPKYVPLQPGKIAEGEPQDQPKGEQYDGEGGTIPGVIPGEPTSVKKTEKVNVGVQGNSPRSLLNRFENSASEKDEVEEISLRFKFNRKLTKEECMKLLKQLPTVDNVDVEIEGEIGVWREKDGI